LSFALRRNPKNTAGTNYDRGNLIGPAFKGNHPHSGDAFEGDMSDALKQGTFYGFPADPPRTLFYL
jgi:hypothetical protein